MAVDKHYVEALRRAKALKAACEACLAECEPPSMRMVMCREDAQIIIHHLTGDIQDMKKRAKGGT